MCACKYPTCVLLHVSYAHHACVLGHVHTQAIESQGDAAASPMGVAPGFAIKRPAVLAERSYRVEQQTGQQMPQPSRSMVSKLYEFVLGM